MPDDVTVLIAEDNPGHARLIEKNLRRSDFPGGIKVFPDGLSLYEFLFGSGGGEHRKPDAHYALLLDIRMPKMDGTQVLRRLKEDPELRKMPVIVLTTTDDPKEVELCHELGCSHFIAKPVNYERLAEVIYRIGQFLSVILVPRIREAK